MGPMMGWGSQGDGAAGLLFLAMAIVLVLLFVFAALALLDSRDGMGRRRHRSPEEILRERYAHGELSRQQYQDALVDILKDRYIRSELTLDEYEARLDLLLHEPLRGRRQGMEEREPPSALRQAKG